MIIAHKKNSAFELTFPMVDSTTPASFKTGLSPVDTAYYKDGAGAWTTLAITDTAAEIGTTGIYEISLTAAEMNHDWVNIKFTASGAADTLITFRMFTHNIDDIVDMNNRINVGSWLDAAVTLSAANKPDVNIDEISDDTTAPGNLELMFDGTGYAGGTTKLNVNVVSQDNIDFGALQKTSLNAATPASVVGNVGGNVVGSIGSLAVQAQEEVGEVTDAIINANTTIGTIKTDIETTGVVVKDLTTAAKALIQTEAEDAVVAKNLDHFTARTSNAQAGGANTITLDTQASSMNDYYNGRTILTTAGTGAGQTRRIVSYNGTTKVATVDSNWSIQPVNGSEFLILNLYDAEVTAIKAKTDLIGASVALETGGNAAAIKTVTDKLETAVELDGAVYRFTTNALEMAPSGGASVGAIADAVWDETAAEHVAAGTTGKKLNDISGGAPINVQHDSTHIVRN